MADKELKPSIPLRGASTGSTFGLTPDGFSPFLALRNARIFGGRTERPRGSRRPTLRRWVDRQLKNAPVQAVLGVTRASAVLGYATSNCRDMGEALSHPAGTLYGQIGSLDDVQSLNWFVNLDVTPAGGPANVDVNACNWDPDHEFLAVSANYKIGSDSCYSVARIDPGTGATVWRTDRHDSGKNVSVNNIVVTKLYTFVLLVNNNAAGPFVVGYRNDTGAEAISGNIGGWCREAVAGCRTVDDNGQENLFVGFLGSAVAGTYTGGIGSGTIQAGRWAMDFRGGIAKFHVESHTYGGGGTTLVQWGTPLPSTGMYYEGVHRTWRLSEQLPWRPHGGEITGLRSGPNGSVYFTKRNQGWGPNNGQDAFKPDGRSEGYRTVGKISRGGLLLWLSDTDSLRKPDDLGNHNDLTYPGDPNGSDPSIQALCVDQTNGDCYVGGRNNDPGFMGAGFCAFGLDGETGEPKWRRNITSATGAIREGAASIDVDGNPWFAGDRNDVWDGAVSRKAMLWKLSKTDGSVLAFFDLAHANIGGLSVAAAGDGRVFFSTPKVT